MLIADWKGVPLRRDEFWADILRDNAIRLGSSQVKTPSSRSRALECLVTVSDHFLVCICFCYSIKREKFGKNFFKKVKAYVMISRRSMPCCSALSIASSS